MPKHYRPPGKKKEGNAAKYITRTKAVHYLQTSLSTFRKLCILKGIFPREPKKKVEGNHKTYYHMKDIAFLAHDPLLEKFRDIRTHKRKIKKALSKKNKDLANRLLNRPPTYKLDRLILERYPTFIDALRDLDDCLNMVHLFAALPAIECIQVERIHNCRRLSHEWQAYISRTHQLRKTFISVKGIYYQAEVEGQKITWLTPHALQQVLTDDVDFNALMGFVNFKLYHSINLEYPPLLDRRLEALGNELYALSQYVAASSATQSKTARSSSSSGADQADIGRTEKFIDESDLRLAQLRHQLPADEPGALMHMMEDVTSVDDEDDETKECKSLFKYFKFFLSREAPRESLLFIIPAFGGVVSWEGDGSPFNESDDSITHQIVDRPTQRHIFLSREYVQPQWVYDCINARIVLPTEGYSVGRVPPPHLSPFVDNEAEGYVPEYAETIKRLQAAAKKQVLPLPGFDDQELGNPQNLLAEGVIDWAEASEAAEKKQNLLIFEQYRDELNLELKGITYSAALGNRNMPGSNDDNIVVKGDDTTNLEQVAEDAQNRSKVSMSRKRRKIYEAMQISKRRKKASVDLLKERKRKAEENQKA